MEDKTNYYVGGKVLDLMRYAVGKEYEINGVIYKIMAILPWEGWNAIKVSEEIESYVFIPQHKLLINGEELIKEANTNP